MATDRRDATIQTLQRAIQIFGVTAHDTKIAAIQCCYAHGLDPHFRYAVFPKMDPNVSAMALEGPMEIPSVEEWQRMVNRVASRQKQL